MCLPAARGLNDGRNIRPSIERSLVLPDTENVSHPLALTFVRDLIRRVADRHFLTNRTDDDALRFQLVARVIDHLILRERIPRRSRRSAKAEIRNQTQAPKLSVT